ncbi:MAG: hypothetical protein WBL05_05510 [Brooklawnia sp.]|uniref:hypothetical protein n=1 Tax=Brooklawnia sp. TaxID=2699740 RepID=UPI003C785342
MLLQREERRPAGNGHGAREIITGTFRLADLDQEAERVRGAFVVKVSITTANRPAVLPDDPPAVRYRRRVFLSIAAAERAARNASERGESARIYLCELLPVQRVQGG